MNILRYLKRIVYFFVGNPSIFSWYSMSIFFLFFNAFFKSYITIDIISVCFDMMLRYFPFFFLYKK